MQSDQEHVGTLNFHIFTFSTIKNMSSSAGYSPATTGAGVEEQPVDIARGDSKLCGWYQFEGVAAAKGYCNVSY
jgi:hypothetical protein